VVFIHCYFPRELDLPVSLSHRTSVSLGYEVDRHLTADDRTSTVDVLMTCFRDYCQQVAPTSDDDDNDDDEDDNRDDNRSLDGDGWMDSPPSPQPKSRKKRKIIKQTQRIKLGSVTVPGHTPATGGRNYVRKRKSDESDKDTEYKYKVPKSGAGSREIATRASVRASMHEDDYDEDSDQSETVADGDGSADKEFRDVMDALGLDRQIAKDEDGKAVQSIKEAVRIHVHYLAYMLSSMDDLDTFMKCVTVSLILTMSQINFTLFSIEKIAQILQICDIYFVYNNDR
jgi:hypothetical protein